MEFGSFSVSIIVAVGCRSQLNGFQSSSELTGSL